MKKKMIVFLASLMVFASTLTAFAADPVNTYYRRTGSLDGYSYILQITGNTTKLTTSITYTDTSKLRTMSITGYYYDTSTGKLTSYGTGGGGYSVKVSATFSPRCTDGRFIRCNSTYTLNGFTTQSGNVTVK